MRTTTQPVLTGTIPNSPYTMKSYSALQPGQSWGYQTPLERGRFWQTPGYYREQTFPWGRETYNLPPTLGGYIERRPIYVYPPPVPYPYAAPYPW